MKKTMYRVKFNGGVADYASEQVAVEYNALVDGSGVEEIEVDVPEISPERLAEIEAEAVDRKRQAALKAEWPEPFALLDDLIADLKGAGFDNLPTILLRDAIKAANPKGAR